MNNPIPLHIAIEAVTTYAKQLPHSEDKVSLLCLLAHCERLQPSYKQLYEDKGIISAIKAYRNDNPGCSLRESKDYIEVQACKEGWQRPNRTRDNIVDNILENVKKQYEQYGFLAAANYYQESINCSHNYAAQRVQELLLKYNWICNEPY